MRRWAYVKICIARPDLLPDCREPLVPPPSFPLPPMAINTGKVLVGGLVAGLVMNVSGFVVQGMLLGKRMMDEMAAVAPSMATHQPGAGEMTGRVLTSFAVGILLVWIYAAIRPRFGPGPKTAMIAAAVVWAFGFLFYLDWL